MSGVVFLKKLFFQYFLYQLKLLSCKEFELNYSEIVVKIFENFITIIQVTSLIKSLRDYLDCSN